MLQRNLLYTGVTRGKRLLVLVGQKKAIAIAVRNVSGGGDGRSSTSGLDAERPVQRPPQLSRTEVRWRWSSRRVRRRVRGARVTLAPKLAARSICHLTLPPLRSREFRSR